MKDNERKEVHIEGFLRMGDCGIRIERESSTLARTVSEAIEGLFSDLQHSEAETDEFTTDISIHTPPISFKAFFSNNKCTLEEAENKQILASIGELDIYQEWFGYSEFTVMGYDVMNFTLKSENGGSHDLQAFFENYENCYTHIVISTVDNN